MSCVCAPDYTCVNCIWRYYQKFSRFTLLVLNHERLPKGDKKPEYRETTWMEQLWS